MAYIQSELERAVELAIPRSNSAIASMGDWFEEMEKALLPLRYLREIALDHGDIDANAIDGYLHVFLAHADNLLAEAWRKGWTNHPREEED